MGIRFVPVDYADPAHGRDLVAVLDAYARDPMGGGEGLPPRVREHLVAALATTPNAFSVLGYADERSPGGERPGHRPPRGLPRGRRPSEDRTLEGRTAKARPVALANCFTSLSTFACRPLVNVHDLAVVATHRGRGVGRALLDAVEREARARGACKLTLEVLEGNAAARRAYERAGFRPYVLDEGLGSALFLEKKL